MSTQIFLVEGMSCKNCKAHVESGIKTIPGVEEVVADHVTGHVKVKGDHFDAEMIKSAVEKAGYRFKGTDKSTSPGSDLWLS
ncbi:MAG: heavy-metal-associated domain-containing protein [Bacteroidetes bacterium]|nr:heavy-metal-associated domain-containing protein [Bacteroidota bacterium]